MTEGRERGGREREREKLISATKSNEKAVCSVPSKVVILF